MLRLKLLRISKLKNHPQKIIFVGLLVGFFIFLNQEKSKILKTAEVVEQSDYLPLTDCGVVLTGASGRIREAFEVFAQLKFRDLIISGVYKDTQLKEIFPQLPFYSKINPDRVVLEKISGSTYANAVQSLLVVEALKCKSILLMTSDIHIYRALRVFKAVFPPNYEIKTYNIVHTAKEKQIFDVYLESFKSLFYNLIIYYVELDIQT